MAKQPVTFENLPLVPVPVVTVISVVPHPAMDTLDVVTVAEQFHETAWVGLSPKGRFDGVTLAVLFKADTLVPLWFAKLHFWDTVNDKSVLGGKDGLRVSARDVKGVKVTASVVACPTYDWGIELPGLSSMSSLRMPEDAIGFAEDGRAVAFAGGLLAPGGGLIPVLLGQDLSGDRLGQIDARKAPL